MWQNVTTLAACQRVDFCQQELVRLDKIFPNPDDKVITTPTEQNKLLHKR